ncbi:MAG TPA: YigZ family protein [Syntrophomonadaceae bacterium]|nr:YigZ family protein [Syntrophomonadaceae bacterium]
MRKLITNKPEVREMNQERPGSMFFRTIVGAADADLTIKKSRFIAILTPINQLQDIEASLQNARLNYPGANHYCYSYRLRQDDVILERSSDDGEPSGTAGWPMLNLLKKMELQNIMVVVIRYFGGTLLGTGGLVRAYTHAVQMAADNAQLMSMKYSQKLIVTLEYSYYGSFQNQFSELMNRVSDIQYADKVRIELWIAVDEVAAFASKVEKLTGGTSAIECGDKGFFPQTA